MADVEDERTPRDINGVLEQLSLDILVIHDAVDRLKYDILHWSEIAKVI